MADNGSAFERWRASGRSHTHRGHALFWQLGGRAPDKVDGSTLLCIHGFPTASWDWYRVWAALCRRFDRVVAPDMIGFGWSDKPLPYDYSILDQADLHEALLRDLGITRTHVLAHDYGDTVAQEMLARHHDRARAGIPTLKLASVCFLNGGLFPETHRARFVQKLLASPLGPKVARLMNERGFGRSFSSVFGPGTRPSAAELHQFWQLLQHNQGTRVMPRLIGYMAERRRHRERWVGALQAPGVPLRLVNGPEDPVSGAHMVARYRELVPSPDVALLPGIGHYPQVEDPGGTTAAYFEFLDGLEAA